MAYTHENKEKVLIKSLDAENHIGYISRFRIGNQLDLYLNDSRGNRLKTYYFKYDTTKLEKTTHGDSGRDRHYRRRRDEIFRMGIEKEMGIYRPSSVERGGAFVQGERDIF